MNNARDMHVFERTWELRCLPFVSIQSTYSYSIGNVGGPHTHANRSTHRVPPLSQLEHSSQKRTDWVEVSTATIYHQDHRRHVRCLCWWVKDFQNQNSKNYYTSTCLTPIGVLTCTLGAYWEGDEASLRSSTQRTVLLFFYCSLKKS